MTKRRQKLIVDRLIEAYVSWRETCLRVSEAYADWTSESGIRATVGFGSYMAALDREEDAAEVYADLVGRATELLWTSSDTADVLDGSAREAGRR